MSILLRNLSTGIKIINCVINNLSERLLELQSLNMVDSALDLLYDDLENPLFKHEFSECNMFMDKLDVEIFHPSILLCILTITSFWKESLVRRESFLEKVEAHLNSLYMEEKAGRLLYGLR